MQQVCDRVELPAGLVVLSTDGRAQFGWQDSETGDYFAEEDGRCIVNAIGSVPWFARAVH
ncbi:hypothetical protein FHX57_006430 [Paraburkholderia tropica]|uniref:Uncharacterized protein n=1 Tax=Paraburkholderia tropica TaxID=92647 RepID=A0AAQ1JXP6_9BURK|nr:hypothetical protein [Paraburkholderia tropica]MBB2984298.1 hypothetical protein [Paraburkholderia tropica]MBB3004051.1 hypothetical protein [Paraburkholderia tropica]MBB6323208.1 hypothetical protein [Paraburkholderia tropica]RQN37285.1 hypothetical protein EHZ25_20255 [Paraburkholderia tropica]SEK12949.1 hypothetical protein SAMN05216550_12337 [Paraburkholderia tropica]